MAMAMAGLLLLLLFRYRLDLFGCSWLFPVDKTTGVGVGSAILELRYDEDGCFETKACAKMIQLPIANSCSTTKSLVMLQNAILLVTTLHNSAAVALCLYSLLLDESVERHGLSRCFAVIFEVIRERKNNV